MNTEIIDKLKEVMTPIAEKIGEGAEFGWITVLKQQYVEATIGLFFAMLGIVGMIIVYKVTRKFWNTIESNYSFKKYENDGIVVFAVLGIFFSIFAFIVGSISAITHFINPEYYAIEFFINLVK